MNETRRARVQEIQHDSTSGATAILGRALALLREASTGPRDDLVELAEELCRAQPSMAGLRTAARRIGTSRDPAAEIDRLSDQIQRAPARIARHAAGLLMLRATDARGASSPMRLVTCSSSAAVEATIVRLSSEMAVTACCAESRPKLEGRMLAARLAAAGARAELFSDAAIAGALAGADALLAGADAVGPSHFVNKSGTHALCALAAAVGVPVYVLAGREKVLDAAAFDGLTLKAGDPAEVWPDPHAGVVVRNPYFERIPLDLVTVLVMDSGPRVI